MTVTFLPARSAPDAALSARFAREVEPLLAVLGRGARRLARSEPEAEDLLQDTLLRAYRGFHTFEDGTNLQAWLFRILYNRWVSVHRAKQARVTEVSAALLTDRDLAATASRLPGGPRSAEAEVLDALPDGDVRSALASLPGGFAEVLFYADIEGYTYAETAVILGIPIGTVMSRVSRGRKRLRIALAHLSHGRGESVVAAVIA
ncbi:sigma-70 family RNA polymerase sigma factor [Mycolicibacterium parafortuitum]|uniref:RNA polymerase sigma factor n=1 Tax=Mycolicibacterium parafortuitum TaxID=39692 RepID=A0A375YL90_MYCPF|nr:sigma-70 family RNA polymerase sigma factor [Mycolicibacterium parafortuitum]ORB28330.1 RNA polymerase subunit sigma-70 [Mycolicibacterium parafortuitum]SRX81744.1 RNA polymerase sigma factor RpoE [Nocardia brasiliensis ATCC] [Mycolicibacterium parafortuitum]